MLSRLTLIVLCLSSLALGPSELALVINRNNPESAKLAAEYAAARNVPDGRIISLDVPDAEEMEFDQYERDVVPPIKSFLRDHHLETQVKCLVTFYGVAFRIRDRTYAPLERQELVDLGSRLNSTMDLITALVDEEEQLAGRLNPDFKPAMKLPQATELQNLLRRSRTAQNLAGVSLNSMGNVPERLDGQKKLLGLITKLDGAAGLYAHLGGPTNGDPEKTGEMDSHRAELRQRIDASKAQIDRLQERRYDADARAGVRRAIAQPFGLMSLAQVLE